MNLAGVCGKSDLSKQFARRSIGMENGESSFFICMKNGLRWRRLRFVSSLAETY